MSSHLIVQVLQKGRCVCSESGTDLLLSRPLKVKQLDPTLELKAQCSSRTEVLVKCTYKTSE